MAEITFPIRVLAEYGIESLLLTNAAGGINRKYQPGEFMAFKDHLNFMGDNPLRGPAHRGLERFVDLTQTYDPVLTKTLKLARKAKAKLHTGVYCAVSGPNYETPAEVHAYDKLGAGAVGMSTVPEAIVPTMACGSLASPALPTPLPDCLVMPSPMKRCFRPVPPPAKPQPNYSPNSPDIMNDPINIISEAIKAREQRKHIPNSRSALRS